MTDRKQFKGFFGRVGDALARFRRDRRANVAIIFALALVPSVGALGLAGEASYWELTQRAAQNAADAAVMAAAMAGGEDLSYNTTQGSGACSSCYSYEGQGVATRYGFVNGSNNVTVSVLENQACPTTASSTVTGGSLGNDICYEVTISKTVPVYLTKFVGFNGNNNNGTNTVTAIAWAGPKNEPVNACVLALGTGSGTTNDAITLHGNPDAELGDCTIFSDQSAKCTGHNSGAFIGGAVGTDDNCGDAEYSNAANVPDPYAADASNIPANDCSNYQQESPTKSSGLPTGQITVPAGSYTAAALVTAITTAGNSTNGSGYAYSTTDASGDPVAEVCGDIEMGGNVTITSGNVIVVVENGQYDLNGTQLTTSGTAGMTAIFQNQGASKLNSSTPWFTSVDNGSGSEIDIAAPTSGTWSGFTVYDPVATGNYEYAGNAPAWDLTGIVYFPNAELDWRGAIGKSGSGFECFDLVVQSLLIDGTADMFSPNLSNPTAQCTQAGVTPPVTNIGYRYVLVE